MYEEKDSLKFGYYSAGVLDSMDCKVASPLLNIPGGSFDGELYITPKFILNHSEFQNFNQREVSHKFTYTSLPHIGFNYAFGSKGTQFLKVDYEQALNSKILLNFKINQNSSNGFLKNSGFSFRDFSFNLRKNGRFYSAKFEGDYSYQKLALNGGVIEDSTLISQGLEYVDVLNGTSSGSFSEIKKNNYTLKNQFNFSKDSTKQFGVSTLHKFKTNNRVFNEVFTSTKYSIINIDSNTTRDQFQLASIENAGGFYLKHRKMYFDALISHRYWNVQNLGNHRDTSEISMLSNLHFVSAKHSFSNQFAFNLVGAKNEWSNQTHFSTSFNKFDLNADALVEQKLPLPIQRSYFSNNYNYQLANYQLQTRFFGNLDLNFEANRNVKFGVNSSFAFLKNNYYFINSVWRNDTLKTNLSSIISIYSSLTYKKFTFQPRCNFSVQSKELNLLPDYHLSARLFLKGKAFKSKKLEYIYGVDLSYISNYRLVGYNYQLEMYTLTNSMKEFKAMLNLNAFIGIAMNEFRMFLKVNNLGYLWNDKTNQQLIGYPIQKNYIQLGITWDFFN